MLSRQVAQGASVSGAPFFCCALLAGLLIGNATQTRADYSCSQAQTGERIRVSHVYDGDTVKLEDGRRLRFIGINTPETGHHDPHIRAWAEKARIRVRQLLARHDQVLLLQPGPQRRDHYARQLAHAFLGNGQSIAVRLLQEGLATTLAVPPNVGRHACYQRHEDRARRAGRGLWSLDAYQAQPGPGLKRNSRGFRIVRGKVLAIRNRRHSIEVDLEGPLRVFINKKDSGYFEPGFIDALPGSLVESRGWIRPQRTGLKMNVRHPAALTRLTAPAINH